MSILKEVLNEKKETVVDVLNELDKHRENAVKRIAKIFMDEGDDGPEAHQDAIDTVDEHLRG